MRFAISIIHGPRPSS